MNKNVFPDLKTAIKECRRSLLEEGNVLKTDSWQGLSTGFEFLELEAVNFISPLPKTCDEAEEMCNPWLPWADDHFMERISGKPLNPPPSHKYWLSGNEEFKSGDKFSHSYPERFWPKSLMESGIRYKTGDLNDLINLLKKDLYTRQAYLPIYFPEDLGASALGERVPCTLGYHFYIRNGKLNVFYPMRSCDALRHFHNDMYLCYRLTEYIMEKVDPDLELGIELGYIHFSCSSFHCFTNDKYALQQSIKG